MSHYLGTILDKAIEISGRVPDLVLAGHVHNYQRFTRQYTLHGKDYQIPYIVAGAGGYHNLHHLPDDVKNAPLPFTDPEVKDMQLTAFCDRQYGFLRLEITPDQKELRGSSVAVPGFQDANVDKVTSEEKDSFELDLESHRLRARVPVGVK